MSAPALYVLPDRDRQRGSLTLQSRVWEPAARALIDDLDLPTGASVLRVGWNDQDGDLPSDRFDLVHARFQLSMLGRPAEQIETFKSLVKPGGVLVLEEPDTRTLVHEPYAPATAHLVGRAAQALKVAGGDLDAGRRLPVLMRRAGLQPHVRTHVLGLEAGHPYLHLPLHLADLHAERLADILGGDGLAYLHRQAANELADPDRRGTTFTLVQAWARV
jgi:Methyltransferase domain